MGGFLRGRPITDDGGGGGAAQPLLALLWPTVQPSDIGAGTLTELSGETVAFLRASAKTCPTSASFATVVQLGNATPAVGPLGLLMESNHTNGLTYSEDQSLWTKRGTAVATGGIDSPRGDTTAYRISGIQAFVTGDIYTSGAGTTGASIAVSMWMRRVSTSGVLRMVTSGGEAGEWRVDLSLLSGGWEFLTSAHPAVTQVTPFTVNCSGLDIMRQTGASPLSFDLWGVQQTPSTHAQSYVPSTTFATTGIRDYCAIPATKVPVASGRVTFNYAPLWNTTPNVPTLFFTTRDDATGLHGLSMQTLTSGPGAVVRAVCSAGSSTVVDSSNLAWVAGQAYAFEFIWGGGALVVKRDGVTVLSGAAASPDSHTGPLRIGCLASGNCADGYFSAFAVWPS